MSAPATLLASVLTLANMPQAELARRTGTSTKHINQLCKGIVPMSVDIALRLEHVLGINALHWLHADAATRVAERRPIVAAAMGQHDATKEAQQ